MKFCFHSQILKFKLLQLKSLPLHVWQQFAERIDLLLGFVLNINQAQGDPSQILNYQALLTITQPEKIVA